MDTYRHLLFQKENVAVFHMFHLLWLVQFLAEASEISVDGSLLATDPIRRKSGRGISMAVVQWVGFRWTVKCRKGKCSERLNALQIVGCSVGMELIHWPPKASSSMRQWFSWIVPVTYRLFRSNKRSKEDRHAWAWGPFWHEESAFAASGLPGSSDELEVLQPPGHSWAGRQDEWQLQIMHPCSQRGILLQQRWGCWRKCNLGRNFLCTLHWTLWDLRLEILFQVSTWVGSNFFFFSHCVALPKSSLWTRLAHGVHLNAHSQALPPETLTQDVAVGSQESAPCLTTGRKTLIRGLWGAASATQIPLLRRIVDTAPRGSVSRQPSALSPLGRASATQSPLANILHLVTDSGRV